jgi:mRNA interferase MazF
MKRGEIWWASLPVLIIQANPFNASRISTIIVAVITSNLALAEAPGNVRISKADSGLAEASVVNVSQIITIDRGILTKKVKALSSSTLEKVSEGLKLALALI